MTAMKEQPSARHAFGDVQGAPFILFAVAVFPVFGKFHFSCRGLVDDVGDVCCGERRGIAYPKDASPFVVNDRVGDITGRESREDRTIAVIAHAVGGVASEQGRYDGIVLLACHYDDGQPVAVRFGEFVELCEPFRTLGIGGVVELDHDRFPVGDGSSVEPLCYIQVRYAFAYHEPLCMQRYG